MKNPIVNALLLDALTDAAAESENNLSPIGETLGDRVATPAYADGENVAVGVSQSMEGGVPRLVTRGESFDTETNEEHSEGWRTRIKNNGFAVVEFVPHPREGVPASAAFTDWLDVTFPFTAPQTPGTFYKTLCATIGDAFGRMIEGKGGLRGYKHKYSFDCEGVYFAYGGAQQHGTALLTISGKGCRLLDPCWKQFHEFLTFLEAKITRWDGAVDDMEGKYSVDLAMQWYLEGRFSTGGNQPTMMQIGNWEVPDGRGRSLYIGRGENGKMMRIYEKGKQMGDPQSPWVRFEVQMRHKNRHIPLDVVLHPGPYIAGSYACMGWVHEEQCRIRTHKKSEEICIEALTRHANMTYGPLINELSERGLSAEEIIERIRRPGKPRRLKAL